MGSQGGMGKVIVAALFAATVAAAITVVALLRGLPDENESRIHVDLTASWHGDSEDAKEHAGAAQAQSRSTSRKGLQCKLKNDVKVQITTNQCERGNNMNISPNKIKALAVASAVSAGVALVDTVVAADIANGAGSSVSVAADAATAAMPVAWKNLDEEHHLGGRVTSEGYMRGKVVLVDRWGKNCPPCRALLSRLEEVWNSFKTKPFVLLGGHCKGWGTADEVKSLIEENKLTYPIYEDAGLAENEPKYDSIPFLYVVDETGFVRYKGRDECRATEVLVTLLTDMESPKDAAMWQKFVDFELKVLPGRAFVRLTEFRKKFPNEAKKYESDYKRLKNDVEVQKLVKLVTFAKMAKDFDKTNKNTKGKVDRTKIGMAIKKFEPLKESTNELVAQEAKNAIADLKWALATFPI